MKMEMQKNKAGLWFPAGQQQAAPIGAAVEWDHNAGQKLDASPWYKRAQGLLLKPSREACYGLEEK